MREVERIDRICNKLAEVWKQNPDQRMLQMMINNLLIRDDYVMWKLEDTEMERFLDERISKSNRNK